MMLVGALMLALTAGCARDVEPIRVETTDTILEPPGPEQKLSAEELKQLVASASEVEAGDVEIIADSVGAELAVIIASIPAHEDLLPRATDVASEASGVQTEQRLEIVDVRWDRHIDAPRDIFWTERLQFAEVEPVSPEEAEHVAKGLKGMFFPPMPEGTGEMLAEPQQRPRGPVYVSTWRGMREGHRTGDRVVVQVSSVTGLPIAYSQRVARQRPAPEDVVVTRDEALEIGREHLIAEQFRRAESVDLVGEMILSASVHPQDGPAWMIAVVGRGGEQLRVIPIDAMTGEVIVRDDEDEAEAGAL